jgi:hypothetical protein
MKTIHTLLALVTLAVTGCRHKNTEVQNSPLATVIKVQAAEALADTEEARKYQDIESIYGKIAREEKSTPEKAWQEYANFVSSVPNGRKFTNQFKYYNYNISESSRDGTAEVTFRDKDTTASVRTIVYRLELRNGNWIVTGIDYVKK